MSYLYDRSHKKAILSLYQVGVPSKHAQIEDKKHLNSNNSTKRNINGRIRAICTQDSAPPGYKHNQFRTKTGCSKKNDIIKYVELRLWHDSSIITNQPWKKV